MPQKIACANTRENITRTAMSGGRYDETSIRNKMLARIRRAESPNALVNKECQSSRPLCGQPKGSADLVTCFEARWFLCSAGYCPLLMPLPFF
jgi:hypothetical protein